MQIETLEACLSFYLRTTWSENDVKSLIVVSLLKCGSDVLQTVDMDIG